jgi:hypothetical protein
MAFTLRLTRETERAIKRRAKKAGVSVNQQIENELRERRFTKDDCRNWGSHISMMKPNPPYVLENIQRQVEREWEQFEKERL